MDTVSTILVALVGLEHVYILYLEMFLWTTPRAMKSFGTTQEFANESKALAMYWGEVACSAPTRGFYGSVCSRQNSVLADCSGASKIHILLTCRTFVRRVDITGRRCGNAASSVHLE